MRIMIEFNTYFNSVNSKNHSIDRELRGKDVDFETPLYFRDKKSTQALIN